MDPKRLLSIRSNSCRRLCGDLSMYVKEKHEQEEKLDRLQQEHADPHDIRKQTEFVEETTNTLLDTRTRARASLVDLTQLMDKHKANAEFSESKEMADARKVVRDAEALLGEEQSSVAKAEAKHASCKCVAVFGSHSCQKGDPLWIIAEELGEKLGAADLHVITGGYCGTMEAISLGASKSGTAIVEGVISPKTFPFRGNQGNPYLTVTTSASSIHHRLVSFIDKAQAFVVLPGNLGTLAELIYTWNTSYCNSFAGQPTLPIFAFRQPWEAAIKALTELKIVNAESVVKHLVFVDTVDEVIARLRALQL